MKKTALSLLMLVFVFGCAGMTGCGSGTEQNAQPTPDTAQEEEQASSDTQQTSQSAGGAMWDDMPVYATAMQLQTASWSIPPQDGDYEKAEWRYYELPSAHDVEMVARFYKMEMPKNGWQQTMEMEVQDVAMLLYAKNNEADAAYVWVGSEDGKTVFALMRASR